MVKEKCFSSKGSNEHEIKKEKVSLDTHSFDMDISLSLFLSLFLFLFHSLHNAHMDEHRGKLGG